MMPTLFNTEAPGQTSRSHLPIQARLGPYLGGLLSYEMPLVVKVYFLILTLFSFTQKGAWQPHWLKVLTKLAGSVPEHWMVIVTLDRGVYAPWLYAKIVSLGWHPFMRINTQGNFRPQGAGKFRSLATAAPEVDCFSGEISRLQCTLLARWDKGYEEVWLIVTDLTPAQAE